VNRHYYGWYTMNATIYKGDTLGTFGDGSDASFASRVYHRTKRWAAIAHSHAGGDR